MTIRVDFSSPPRVSIMVWTGFARIEEHTQVTYSNQDALPEWLQRKLAVLMSIDPETITEEIPKIGRRVSRHVYWVYPSIGETLGTDTRAKGKKRRPKDA